VESDIAPLPGEYVRLHVLMPDEEGPLEGGLARAAGWSCESSDRITEGTRQAARTSWLFGRLR
jgi:hypothetical protein